MFSSNLKAIFECVINVVLQVSGQDDLVALGALLPDLEVTLCRPLGVDGAEVLLVAVIVAAGGFAVRHVTVLQLRGTPQYLGR